MNSEQVTFTIFFVFSLLLHVGISIIINPDNYPLFIPRKYIYLDVYKKNLHSTSMTEPAIKTVKPKLKHKENGNTSKRSTVPETPFKRVLPEVLPADSLNQKNVTNIPVESKVEPVVSSEEMKQVGEKGEKFLTLEDVNEALGQSSLEEGGSSDVDSSWKATDFDFEAYTVYVKEFLQKSIEYPYLARNRNIEGELSLEVVVEVDGKLSEYKILKTSGYKILDEHTLNKLRDLVLDKKPSFRAVLQFNLVYRLD